MLFLSTNSCTNSKYYKSFSKKECTRDLTIISNDSEKLPETEVSVSSNPAHDHTYFRNKTLEQYPNLYREFSSENVDYYGITDETLCPLCEVKS